MDAKLPAPPPIKHWWIALTYIAGAAFIASALGVEDPAFRRRIVELTFGGFLFGLGFWMRMPTVPEVIADRYVVHEHGRWPLLGWPIMIVGFLLVVVTLVQLVWMSV